MKIDRRQASPGVDLGVAEGIGAEAVRSAAAVQVPEPLPDMGEGFWRFRFLDRLTGLGEVFSEGDALLVGRVEFDGLPDRVADVDDQAFIKADWSSAALST